MIHAQDDSETIGTLLKLLLKELEHRGYTVYREGFGSAYVWVHDDQVVIENSLNGWRIHCDRKGV
jgi:hypothetical protein